MASGESGFWLVGAVLVCVVASLLSPADGVDAGRLDERPDFSRLCFSGLWQTPQPVCSGRGLGPRLGVLCLKATCCQHTALADWPRQVET